LVRDRTTAYNRDVTDRAPAAPLHDLVLTTLKEQGRSQNWLHKRTGVSRNTITSWKTQPRPPQAGTVLTIADALGIDRGEALRLAGVMSDTKAAIEGTTVDLSEVHIDALLAEIRRRVPD
jgi:transcriptional regulator with XRE-family HTH domain